MNALRSERIEAKLRCVISFVVFSYFLLFFYEVAENLSGVRGFNKSHPTRRKPLVFAADAGLWAFPRAFLRGGY